MTPAVACVLGTYNRFAALRTCVESIRRAAGKFSIVALVADGGSTDGSREWLAEQPDCELLEGGLDGAVRAFNVAFARAVELDAPFVAQLNDDLELLTPPPILERAADLMLADESIGAVAFASDRYTPGRHSFENMRYHGRCYANQGLFRREAGMAAARAMGDPTGTAWWCRDFHTYASDTCLGLWLWRLGWRIHEAPELRVHDPYASGAGHLDPLRKRNLEQYTNSARFVAEWGDPRNVTYCREDARRFGGRLI